MAREPRADLVEEIKKLSVVEALALRIGQDPLLVGAVRHVEKIRAASQISLPKPFDGQDASEETPLLLTEALLRTQKMLLEDGAFPPSPDGRIDPNVVVMQTRLRELDRLLRQALRVSIDVHLFSAGVG